jgi:hypothetical protein
MQTTKEVLFLKLYLLTRPDRGTRPMILWGLQARTLDPFCHTCICVAIRPGAEPPLIQESGADLAAATRCTIVGFFRSPEHRRAINLDVMSAFRHSARDKGVFFKSTRWAFLVNLPDRGAVEIGRLRR